jgi:cytochrome c biogenesis protein CcdA
VDLSLGSYGFGFLAGVLSILSPCVLPLVPIVLGGAVATHRLGAVALAVGLALSFTVVGMFIATVGFAIGLDADWFRKLAAILLVLLGVVLVSGTLQQRFAAATSSLSTLGDRLIARLRLDGLTGQFSVGLLLGLVWAPCAGPTLGAAATLASQGRQLAQVAGVMALFGIGAALPLVVLGHSSRTAMMRARNTLLSAGVVGKYLLGGLLIAVGVLILTGMAKVIEAWLVAISPEWLTRVTTRF